MGHYTELRFKAKLKKSTSQNVVDLLERVINEQDLGLDQNKVLFTKEDVFEPDIDHPFFKCERWYMLFLSTNFDNEMQGGKFYKKDGRWVLDLHNEFKNYDSEIEHFVNWIRPFVEGRKKKEYVGYKKSEDMNSRVNLYIEI